MPAASVADQVDAFVEAVKDAQLRAWLSRSEIQPPGYYIALEEISYVLSGVDFGAVVRVYAVSSNSDEGRAMRELDELHRKFIDADFFPEGNSTVVGVNVPGQAKPLPALRMTLSLNT